MSRLGGYQIIDLKMDNLYDIIEEVNGTKPLLVSGLQEFLEIETIPDVSFVKKVEMTSTNAFLTLENGGFVTIPANDEEEIKYIDFDNYPLELASTIENDHIEYVFTDYDLPYGDYKGQLLTQNGTKIVYFDVHLSYQETTNDIVTDSFVVVVQGNIFYINVICFNENDTLNVYLRVYGSDGTPTKGLDELIKYLILLRKD